MASEVDICNLALNKIGQNTIISLTEDSKAARICNLFYADTRDSLLRQHPWNFAVKRVELAKLTTTPVFGFDNEFQLPSDCLRVMYTNLQFPQDKFRIEGKKLLADSDSIKVEYISRVEDTTQFDALFVDALWMSLAARISYNISDNNTLVNFLDNKVKEVIRHAKSIDGQEGIPYPIAADDWLNSRL
jgi:hypothetical protein